MSETEYKNVSDMMKIGKKRSLFRSPPSSNSNHNARSSNMNTSSSKEKKASSLPSFTWVKGIQLSVYILTSERLSPNGSTTIVIFVGSSRQKFVVHKSFLCHHSPYFQKSLNGQFQEAQTGVVNLDDVDIHAFGLFVDWLYTGQTNEAKTKPSKGKITWEEATELWILADYLQIPTLQNHTVKMILEKNEEQDISGLFESCLRCWDQTPGYGPLLSLLVDKLSNVEMLGSKVRGFNKAPSLMLAHLFNIFTDVTPKQRKKRQDWNAQDYYV